MYYKKFSVKEIFILFGRVRNNLPGSIELESLTYIKIEFDLNNILYGKKMGWDSRPLLVHIIN